MESTQGQVFEALGRGFLDPPDRSPREVSILKPGLFDNIELESTQASVNGVNSGQLLEATERNQHHHFDAKTF